MPRWAKPTEAYGSRRRVCVCVCVCVCHSAKYCLHFLCHRWTLRTEMCLTQCYLEIEFWIRDFLLSSYGVICSPWRLLPAVQSPAKNKSLTTGCLSTWQFNLYNKSGGTRSEIQRMRLPKLRCLPQHTTDCMQLKAWPNLAPTHAWLCCGLHSIPWYC